LSSAINHSARRKTSSSENSSPVMSSARSARAARTTPRESRSLCSRRSLTGASSWRLCGPTLSCGGHRDLFRLFWRLKSRQRGRPRIPIDVQRLIAEMATHNRTWGEERIAAELRVKLGLTVSPRTVRRYMPSRPPSRGGRSAQSWTTFLHNHVGAVLACDFFIVVTATFQRLDVYVSTGVEDAGACAASERAL
jgi:hypothetical protein